MKRDNDYIRKILLDFEASEKHLLIDPMCLNPSTEELKLHFHIQLLADVGYFLETGKDVYRMINSGHDFLESIRDDGIWQQTTEIVAKAGGNATLEIIKSIGIGFIKTKIKNIRELICDISSKRRVRALHAPLRYRHNRCVETTHPTG